MEQSRTRLISLPLSFIVFTLCYLLCVTALSAHAYKNYTVGDDLGWYDNTENSKVDYQKWAAGKNFSLGDFLIFNSNNNHSVIQTYNATTYKLCDNVDAPDNDTVQWSTDDPSNTAPHPVSVPVPLLKTGTTYFFSGDYDGDQCRSGMHFSINVTYGKGLPESLKDPSEQAPAPINPDSGEDLPETIVPANFDHPQDVSDDTDSAPSNSISISAFSKLFGFQLHVILILLGLSSIF